MDFASIEVHLDRCSVHLLRAGDLVAARPFGLGAALWISMATLSLGGIVTHVIR